MPDYRDVDWTSLHTVHGDASAVPNALNGLRSHDKVESERSYWMLDNQVVVQSDLYDSAYYVIPFVVDIIQDVKNGGHLRAYDLLYEIANGYGPPSITCKTGDGVTMPLRDACRMEIAKHRHIFDRDLNSDDPAIRERVAALLELLDDR